MMDKTYILENGILEQYVLGELTASEQQQVEVALGLHAELRKQLEQIEIDFENLAFENGINAPDTVKKQLFQSIADKGVKTLPIDSNKTKNYSLGIAASIAGLLSIGSIYMYSELASIKQQLQIVEQDNIQLNTDLENLNTDLVETKKWYATINDPETEKYVLKGNSLLPSATLISYVNDSKKSVVINTEQLPKLDKEHDYQMWADVEGVMVNMGIIDPNKDMLAMNYIENAESLNITIEPVGGSDHPTVSQLVTNIYLK